MSKTFPKLIRLDKSAQADCYGVADSPVGFLFAAWQGPLLVKLSVLPAGAEKRAAEVAADFGWKSAKRDDKRATKLVSSTLFPNNKWTGWFSNDVQLGYAGTDFQWEIMKKILKIPSGKTMSYGAIANAANVPGASRAVGTICARNPIALIVPCHRVLAANAKLGGYGYGTAMKRQFLEWER